MGSAAAARGGCASPWSAARRGLLVPSRRRLEGAPVGQTGVVAAPDAGALVSCRSALEAHGVAHDAGLVCRFRSDVARAGRGRSRVALHAVAVELVAPEACRAAPGAGRWPAGVEGRRLARARQRRVPLEAEPLADRAGRLKGDGRDPAACYPEAPNRPGRSRCQGISGSRGRRSSPGRSLVDCGSSLPIAPARPALGIRQHSCANWACCTDTKCSVESPLRRLARLKSGNSGIYSRYTS